MKFLCPSCKAKYQISDDKVAGRSVRMKCRKCGHMISISKAVTEGSVSRKLDGLSSRPPPPSRPSGAWREPGATPAPPKGAPRPPPRGPSPRPPTARAAPPPRPGSSPSVSRPNEPRIAPGHSAAQVARLSQPTVVAEPPAALRRAGAGAATPGASDFNAFDDDERTVVASVGGLASAFTQAVTAPEAAPLSTLSTPADEWYVGINGVPVGPIRLSELRSKASTGSITLDSLVWRDGFEEWIALRTFPELVAIVEEGLSSARASLTPLSPQISPQPTAAAAAALSAPTPSPAQPGVYDPFSMPGDVGRIGDPFAASAASAPAAGAFAPPADRPPVEIDESVVPKRSATPIAAWLAVAAALIAGLGIGFVLFYKNRPAEPVIKYVEVPAKGAASGAAAPAAGNEGPSETPAEGEDAGAKAAAGGKAVAGGPKTGPVATGKTENGKPLTGLAGLAGLQGPGPSSGPGSSGGTKASSDGLDADAIQKTVGRYTGSVKRSCWQPALDTRAKDAPSSARVNVTINVAPSGSVTGVSTSGDPKGYRGLAGCIASRVRGWQFPPSGGPTTVNVPFVFAAQ